MDSVSTKCHELVIESRNISGRVTTKVRRMTYLGSIEMFGAKPEGIRVDRHSYQCDTCKAVLQYDQARTTR